jgi:hypothetical protein
MQGQNGKKFVTYDHAMQNHARKKIIPCIFYVNIDFSIKKDFIDFFFSQYFDFVDFWVKVLTLLTYFLKMQK